MGELPARRLCHTASTAAASSLSCCFSAHKTTLIYVGVLCFRLLTLQRGLHGRAASLHGRAASQALVPHRIHRCCFSASSAEV